MSLNYCASFRLRRIVSFLLLIVLLGALSISAAAKDKQKPPAAPAKSTKKNPRETATRPAKGKAAETRSNNQTAREKAAAAKDNGKNSKREREKAARLLAERRRQEALEAERRRRAAAAAAEARRRAIDQGLRDETQANILRDETTGEDLEIRRIAIQALGNKAGSVVVMDPKSGRVFTVVNQDWALRKGYKPCSTIKLVTGMAGLSEHVIGNSDTINIADRSYRLDLTDSLAYSNNGYFQNVGGQVGFERMVKYARQLGLGEPTGINQPNESAGRVPLFKSGYAVNHMSSHGDDFEVTPIQLATLVSAMANGGNLLTPHLPRTPEENYNFRRIVRRRIDVSQDVVQRMTPGMIGAVNYGTAKLAFDPVQTIAGKTGSCIGQGSWLGLFASYAPVMDPKLAVVVVTRGSGERGKYAAAVAGKIYRALDGRYGQPDRIPLAQVPANMTPRPKVDAQTAAALSDEDQEDEAVDAVEMKTDTVRSVSEPKQTQLKRTVLTAPVTRPATPSTRATPSNSHPVAPPTPTVTLPMPSDQRPRIVQMNKP